MEIQRAKVGMSNKIGQARVDLNGVVDNRFIRSGVFSSQEVCGLGVRPEKGLVHKHLRLVHLGVAS